MNDEIKELLKTIKSYENEEVCMVILSQEQNKALLDYITNLQQENERLRQQNFNLIEYRDSIIDENREQREDLFDYKSRVEKAIKWFDFIDEYIENEMWDWFECSKKEILELYYILQGGD